MKGWNNGLQRPALFVATRPVEGLVWLSMRPDIEKESVLGTLVTGESFDGEFGAHVAASLGWNSGSVMNLIHLSNRWNEKNELIDLNKIRMDSLYVLSLAMGLGSSLQSLALLRGAQTTSTLGAILGGLDLTASVLSVSGSLFGLLHVRENLAEVPEGPARATLRIALILTDAAPYLSALSLGSNVLQAASRIVSRYSVLTAAAQRQGVSARLLAADLMEKSRVVADREALEVAQKLVEKKGAAAAQVLDEAAEEALRRTNPSQNPASFFGPLKSLADYERLVAEQTAKGSVKLAGIARPGIAKWSDKYGKIMIVEGAGRFEKARPDDWLDVFVEVHDTLPKSAIVNATGVPADLVAKANLLSSRGAAGTNPELVEFVTAGKTFKRIFVQRSEAMVTTSKIAKDVERGRKALIAAVGEEQAGILLTEKKFDGESLVNQNELLKNLLKIP